MNIVKPRITPDYASRSGFVCVSVQPGLSLWREGGSVRVTGTGDTIYEAYANWKSRLEMRMSAYETQLKGEKP